MAYFSFGFNGMTRFFPQMLVSIMPRFFRRPHHLSEAEYLRKIYSNPFKNGWCVTLEDHFFEKYYKQITTFTHVTVNYNRNVLYDEFHKDKPMLCFMDLLYHEMESNVTFDANDIHQIDSFLHDNGYCTESIVDDVCVVHGVVPIANGPKHRSNIEISMLSQQQYSQFEIIRSVVHQYNDPSPQHKPDVCGIDNVFSVDQCTFVQTIIDALKQCRQEKMDKLTINISDLLGAYDHMVSVHGFWLRNQTEHNHVQAENEESQPFESIQHSQNISKAERHIVDAIGGYCTSKSCHILRKHITRRREKDGTNRDDNTEPTHGGLDEILHATLNALHCYLAHEKKELFRLKRENGNSHFITSPMDEAEQEEHKTA
eukprot:919428_1